jgi:superoxide dismutase, Cu-Zn family
MHPRTFVRPSLLAALLASAALADAGDGEASHRRPIAIHMMDAADRPIGVVVMTASPGGIAFALDLHGVPPGDHAVVLHATSACAAGEAEIVTRGPRRGVRGADRPRLAVELPDVTADDGGVVQATIVLADPSLVRVLADRDGGALAVHAGPAPAADPADPADRIACGVIAAGHSARIGHTRQATPP